jgi:peptidoglycan/LPS O-acetylase OafA/YrhL
MHPRVLDLVRGLAAVYVVAFHAVHLLWSNLPADGLSPAGAVVQMLFGFGHQAVLLFFLVSGFCIHYGQARSGARRIDVARFAWRRTRRLYPPLLLALLLTSTLDAVGLQVNAALYTGGTQYGWHHFVKNDRAPLTLVGNLAFQAGLVVPAWGSNGPLWSLAYEFWFYALYPLVVWGMRRLGPHAALATSWAITIGAALASNQLDLWPLDVMSCWAVWVSGAYVAELHAKGAAPNVLRLAGPIAAMWWLVLAVGFVSGHDYYPDFLWGAPLAVALGSVMLVPPARVARLIEGLAGRLRCLGAISYSLYLLHHSWLALLAALWMAAHARLPVGPELAIVGFVSSLGLGWLGWYLVERHFVTRPGAAGPVSSRRALATVSA